MKMIVALCDCNNGIGKDNTLLWNIPQDLKRFAELTKDSVVVMGHNTFKSIPKHKRPLKNRHNIVISNNYETLQKDNAHHENLIFCALDQVQHILEGLKQRYVTCYFIGGQSIYEAFIDQVNVVHITRIYKDYECDRFFPQSYKNNFMMYESSQRIKSNNEDCYYVFENWGRIK
jgi:dihydrofolate reductase